MLESSRWLTTSFQILKTGFENLSHRQINFGIKGRLRINSSLVCQDTTKTIHVEVSVANG